MKDLFAESMKLFKRRRHFEKEHPTYKDRDIYYIQIISDSGKKSRIDTTGQASVNTRADIEGSYIVSLRIAKSKKSHNIGKN